MRVALVIYGPIDQVSGGYFYDRKLVAHLEQRGDRVDILSIPGTNYALALLQAPRAAQLDYSPYDVVILDELVHPSFFLTNLWRCPKGAGSGGPLILALVHHLRVSEAHPPYLVPLYRWVERTFFARADGFIFNTPFTKDSVQRLFPNRLPSVIGLPSGNFPRKDPEEGPRPMEEGEALTLLFVGNVIKRKGLHSLLEALLILNAEGKNVVKTLLVAGNVHVDPAYVRGLYTMAARLPPGMVQFLGPVSDAKLLELYGQSQILAVPSTHEGFGIVYLEAMGQGLIPLASADGGASLLVDHGVNGFLVRPGDAGQLKRILEELGTDRQLLNRMRSAALHKAASFPDWEASMEAVYNFIHDTVRKGGGRNIRQPAGPSPEAPK